MTPFTDLPRKMQAARSLFPLAAAIAFVLLALSESSSGQASGIQVPSSVDSALTTSPVIINEILSHTDPPLVDSVELYNRSFGDVDIGGWCISDQTEDPCRTRLPQGLVIPTGSYLVITESLLGFRLSEMGEDLLLSETTPDGTLSGVQHRVEFGASPNGVSLGRVITSDGREFFPIQRARTLGSANVGPASPLLVLAEIQAAGSPEYLEIFNPGPQSVPLFDPEHPGNLWKLDGVAPFTFPAAILSPGESLFATETTPDAFRTRYNLPATTLVVQFGGGIRGQGEQIALMRPEPPNIEDGVVPYVVIDEVGTNNGWPWSSSSTQERLDLTAFGQEPAAWGTPGISLESGPTVQGLQVTVAPAGGTGGRVVRWTTTREWRSEEFIILVEEASGSSSAQTSIPLTLQQAAIGNRHQPASYAVPHPDAATEETYRYTLRVRWQNGSEETLATVMAGPEVRSFLPLARVPHP